MHSLILILVLTQTPSAAKIPVYIAGLWPFSGTGWLGGQEALPAITLALDVINNSTEILPNHEVHLIWNDTQNKASVALREFFDLMYSDPVKVFMIGPCTSRVALHVSIAATSWNLVHVSFAAGSTLLEDKNSYRYFFRTVPADNANNPVRMALLRKFQWNTVALLSQIHDGNVFEKTMEELRTTLLQEKYTVIASERVEAGATDKMKLVISQLKKLDARIIIANFFFTTAAELFCEAYKQGLIWPKHVWIVPNAFDYFWREGGTNCTQEEMEESAKYHISLKSLTSSDTINGSFGISTESFYSIVRQVNVPYCRYCAYAFDAVMSAGLVLHQVHESGLPLEKFSYDNSSYSEAFVSSLTALSFNGMSGPVGFDRKGNRIGQSLVEQLQDGVLKTVGLYDTREQRLFTEGYSPIVWANGRVPRDSVRRSQVKLSTDNNTFIPMATLASLGIVMAVGFLTFNVKFRNLRLIKLSSPVMNNMIVLGSVFAYVSVILYGIDCGTVSGYSFDIMCSTRLGFLSIGFTLGFGAMFSKTWRVHRIMANKTTTASTMRMKDIHLTGRIMALLVLDIVFLTVWVTVDPLEASYLALPDKIEEHEDDHILEPYIIRCESDFEVYWVGAMLVYKGVLLLFGSFLAWETRNIRVDALNDSRHIGLCVYNTAVICIIAVPLAFIMGDENVQGSYVIKSIFVILCTTVALCIIFIPKIYALYYNPTGEVDVRFQTGRSNATSASHTHSGTQSKVTPLEQITSNIIIQRRMETVLKEKEKRIEELETALSEVRQSSTV